MKIQQLMSKDPKACSPSDTLECAARIMWERDCGAVPIVDAGGRVVGMITDRDICIASYTQSKVLGELPIASIAMKPVVSVRPHDPAETAEALMQQHQVRRIAVVDDGGRLVGMLSLSDLARASRRYPRELPSDDVTRTLAAIGQPRTATTSTVAAE